MYNHKHVYIGTYIIYRNHFELLIDVHWSVSIAQSSVNCKHFTTSPPVCIHGQFEGNLSPSDRTIGSISNLSNFVRYVPVYPSMYLRVVSITSRLVILKFLHTIRLAS